MSFRRGIVIAFQLLLRFLKRLLKPDVDGILSIGAKSMQSEKMIPGRDERVSGIITDHGGRRKREDRRQFVYTFHIPERRSGGDRRSGEDRRTIGREPEIQ